MAQHFGPDVLAHFRVSGQFRFCRHCSSNPTKARKAARGVKGRFAKATSRNRLRNHVLTAHKNVNEIVSRTFREGPGDTGKLCTVQVSENVLKHLLREFAGQEFLSDSGSE